MKRYQFLCFIATAAAASLPGIINCGPARAADIVAEWGSVTPPPAPALKAVSLDAKTTALLMMDFLPANYCGGKPRCVAELPAMKQLLAAARASGVTVIYSIAGDFGPSDILKDVSPTANEPVVKARADKFLGTDLEKILKDKGIQTVIVNGTAANGAVLYTGSAAALRGFKVVVPVDGLSSTELYPEQVTVWQLSHGPGVAPQVTLTRSDMIKF